MIATTAMIPFQYGKIFTSTFALHSKPKAALNRSTDSETGNRQLQFLNKKSETYSKIFSSEHHPNTCKFCAFVWRFE